jgi:hypothetical protein
MSRTTGYATLIRRVKWKENDLKATLVSPVFSRVADGGDARVKVPPAQGEAVAALINSGLDQDWRSSDSLPLEFKCL